MPVYEYRCEGCGKHIEVARKISDPPLETCESCNGRLVKLISNTSFVLKGGGWYADGYGSSDSKDKSKGAEKVASSSSEAPAAASPSQAAGPASSSTGSTSGSSSGSSSGGSSSGGDSKAA